jgi:hypothetical protein
MRWNLPCSPARPWPRLIHEHPGVGAKLLVKITQLLAQRLRNTTQQLTRLLDSRTLQGAAGRGENRAL